MKEQMAIPLNWIGIKNGTKTISASTTGDIPTGQLHPNMYCK